MHRISALRPQGTRSIGPGSTTSRVGAAGWLSRTGGPRAGSLCSASSASSASFAEELGSLLANTRVHRPTLDDVQRLSEGRAAKTRGWGSRQVCHRLNAEERRQYKLALDKSFLTLKGTGYRKERKGAPLANIYRQYCDATSVPCVNVLLAGTSNYVLIEQSTMRRWQVDADRGLVVDARVTSRLKECMEAVYGDERGSVLPYLTRKELAEVVPWTVLVPPEIVEKTAGEGLDAGVIAHYCSGAIWQIPVEILGVNVEDRGLAKRLAAEVGGLAW